MKPGDLVKIVGYSVPVYAPHASDNWDDDDDTFLGRIENGSIGIFLGSTTFSRRPAITYHMIFTSQWGPVWVRNAWVEEVDE